MKNKRGRGLKGCFDLQLNPALTDFRGLIILFCYRRIFVIANKRYKRKKLEETIKSFICHEETDETNTERLQYGVATITA